MQAVHADAEIILEIKELTIFVEREVGQYHSCFSRRQFISSVGIKSIVNAGW